MNAQSIVQFSDANGEFAGMGVVVAPRRVVTTNDVIKSALGQLEESDSMPTEAVSFRLLFSSSTIAISSRVVGWHLASRGRRTPSYIAVLETSSESADFLSPAPLISARDTNFYFDRRFRALAYSGPSYRYVRGTLEGLLPSGLVQAEYEGDVPTASTAPPFGILRLAACLASFVALVVELASWLPHRS
jgi:hypothetical protein